MKRRSASLMEGHRGGFVRKAIQGLGLAILVAVANSLCFPILLELSLLIEELKHSGSWTGPLGYIEPEFWLIYAILGAIYLSLPSLIVGLAFFGAYQLPSLRNHRQKRRILPASVFLGSLVALVGMVFFFADQWGLVFPEAWVFAVLAWIAEVLIFVWLGQRIAESSKDSG